MMKNVRIIEGNDGYVEILGVDLETTKTVVHYANREFVVLKVPSRKVWASRGEQESIPGEFIVFQVHDYDPNPESGYARREWRGQRLFDMPIRTPKEGAR